MLKEWAGCQKACFEGIKKIKTMFKLMGIKGNLNVCQVCNNQFHKTERIKDTEVRKEIIISVKRRIQNLRQDKYLHTDSPTCLRRKKKSIYISQWKI